jgi:glyoxylase-like metal-dependent hydrolase (beta-lactamase superfamily II)
MRPTRNPNAAPGLVVERNGKSVFARQPGTPEERLAASLGRLAAYRFERVLPGHGWPVQLPVEEMNSRLRALVARMEHGGPR